MRVLLLSAAIVVADQVSKMLVRGISLPSLGIRWAGLPRGGSFPVLGEFFRLTYVENPVGIAVITLQTEALDLPAGSGHIALVRRRHVALPVVVPPPRYDLAPFPHG